MKGICPNCETEQVLEEFRGNEIIDVRDDEIEVEVEYLKCARCGVEFRPPGLFPDPLETAYSLYRDKHGFLSPESIKQFRADYGFTQRELASLLGWGAVTISRYENGALQDEAHDTALKLVMDPQNLLRLIKRKPGILPTNKQARLMTSLETTINQNGGSLKAVFEKQFGNYEPGEYSGYKRLDIEKLLNAILYFATDETPSMTKLNKLLFYCDFKHFKDYSNSITGVRYAHLPYGPAPDNYRYYIAILHHGENAIEIEERIFNDCSGEYVISRSKPDLNIFNTSELNVLTQIKELFSESTASQLTERSHDEEAYKNTSNGELISYQYAEKLSI